MRNRGDVPYRRKPAGNKDELFIGATDRDIILTDMINDLIEVEPVMWYAEESDRGDVYKRQDHSRAGSNRKRLPTKRTTV